MKKTIPIILFYLFLAFPFHTNAEKFTSTTDNFELNIPANSDIFSFRNSITFRSTDENIFHNIKWEKTTLTPFQFMSAEDRSNFSKNFLRGDQLNFKNHQSSYHLTHQAFGSIRIEINLVNNTYWVFSFVVFEDRLYSLSTRINQGEQSLKIHTDFLDSITFRNYETYFK